MVVPPLAFLACPLVIEVEPKAVELSYSIRWLLPLSLVRRLEATVVSFFTSTHLSLPVTLCCRFKAAVRRLLWSPSRLMIMLIDMNVHKSIVRYLCKLCSFSARRSFLLKHDYKRYIDIIYEGIHGYVVDSKHPPSLVTIKIIPYPFTNVCLVFPSLIFNAAFPFQAFSSLFMPTSSGVFPSHPSRQLGGAVFSYLPAKIEPYAVDGHVNIGPDIVLKYVAHVDSSGLSSYNISRGFVHAQVPIRYLVNHMSVAAQKSIARMHGIRVPNRITRDELPSIFDGHDCLACNLMYSVFSTSPSPQALINARMRRSYANRAPRTTVLSNRDSSRARSVVTLDDEAIAAPAAFFPPSPVTPDLSHKIITGFCKSTGSRYVEEEGCAVCGLLKPTHNMVPLKNIKRRLHILKASGVTRIERSSDRRAVSEFSGPVLDYGCKNVCESCRSSIVAGKVPKSALANGLWLGDVPPALKRLNFVERLLVARIRHTRCYTRVTASGLSKMKAHVIAFQAPVEKVYDMLPPPSEDLDDVLAILFTGNCHPTEADLKRTPLLVRRNVVAAALDWLKLNHSDYKHVSISHENLATYPEDRPPVSIVYRNSSVLASTEEPAVFDNGEEDGAVDGECPFVVHGLTGEEMSTKSIEALKGIALKHWRSNGKALRVGHSENPKSTFNDPSLYPQMFPWLFPYGLGGVGACTSGLSVKAHKKNLLLYHDKRFQIDVEFPFVAFSHEQVKAATSGGYIAVKKKNFMAMAERLLSLDQTVLNNIASRMATGEVVKPVSEEEKQCFQVVNDLDAVAGKVDGSGATKRLMRSEIWSLMVSKGAPSWYITLSPADLKHPVCLYFADTKRPFQPSIQVSGDDAFRLISRNPVAGARFFHFMVTAFIEHVLGVGADHPGLYGDTSAYYGTVEQQGRLTLHLHMLLWIQGGPSPDEARRKIMDSESNFQKTLVEYLEAAYQGDFLTGDMDKIRANVNAASELPDYVDPTRQMPEPPPAPCEDKCDECKACKSLSSWWGRFRDTVDALIYRSNVHTCSSTLNRDGTQKRNKEHKGCLDNIWGKCKARFPRKLFAQTEVDPETGALNMKKSEPWINTFSAVLTYLFRCNTDVTSLRSGTAIKAIILYVTKYVTKPMLKTYVAFDAVRSIFGKSTIVLGGSLPRQEKARSLMTKIVNVLSAKSEMGSPMICMYLLQNPDHYTNYSFEPLHWTSYVREARKAWDSEESSETDPCPEKVTILKVRGCVVGLSSVYDYIYRNPSLEHMSLYEWASRCKRVKRTVDPKDSVALGGGRSTRSQQTTSVVLPFLEDHPLSDTHATTCCPPLRNHIPNLIGGTLPRRDQGDREYYCSTMLTLFKPWRTGRDLKTNENTWDQSFLEYNFSPTHLTIMNNMNLRYECLDARDDYHAQMKAGTVGLPASFMRQDNDDLLENMDQQEYGESEINAVDESSESSVDELKLGKGEQTRRSNIALMSRIMSTVGWTRPCPERCPSFLSANVGDIDTDLTSGQWRTKVADKRTEILAERSKNLPAGVGLGRRKESNVVDVVSKSFFEHSFRSEKWEPIIHDVVEQYKLNKEQERAFRIVANHAAEPNSEQLKMYMGGMGGTGKSRVLKALISYFDFRQESHRLVVVAPTGTAASLLSGSTYHYMFGINDQTNVSKIQLAQVKSRLVGVDYVFFDEVSMLSCRDMYRIAARLAQISGDISMPFGGMNMLFAGDFAQLPPVIGGEHASLYSRTVGASTSSLSDQEAAIGKSVWHQVTTVVILRQNMRQRQQSTRDNELRTALENMRYKACTPSDITFLRGRVSSNLPGRPNISDPEFRNVSVITALNVHKDAINILGSGRFASESKQTLVSFYSDDLPAMEAANPDDVMTSRKGFGAPKPRAKTRKGLIPNSIQKCLWNQPPCSNTKRVAGRLDLCAGLPVIIRHNAATELCITNGQEGTVFGWQEAVGSRGQRTLDTLFVKLSNPPVPVKLDGLPEGVVPLAKTNVTTKCHLTSDDVIMISRSQIEVLPNYAMTDYSSQGKTRPYNVVDLHNCRSHQSYYTALSRSASADGTLILQGFDAGKITGKASGALRQEFRELELLDDITRLRYLGKLPKDMHDAEQRNTLISSYRTLKGDAYIPSSVHKAIKWCKGDPYLEAAYDEVPWKIVEKVRSEQPESTCKPGVLYIPARGTKPYSESSTFVGCSKRKQETAWLSEESDSPTRKKRRTESSTLPMPVARPEDAPLGTQWQDNSCAYDAVITVLYEAWKGRPVPGNRLVEFADLNAAYLGTMARLFEQRGLRNDMPLERIRDVIRSQLRDEDSLTFPYGQYTSVHSVLDNILSTIYPVLTSIVKCSMGHAVNRAVAQIKSAHILLLERDRRSVQDHVRNLSMPSGSRCRTCSRSLLCTLSFVNAPVFLAFDVSNVTPSVDYSLEVPVEGRVTGYVLIGVVYYGEHHFTCRVVDGGRGVWFHDGISTGSQLLSEGHLDSVNFLSCRSKSATVILYARCS